MTVIVANYSGSPHSILGNIILSRYINTFSLRKNINFLRFFDLLINMTSHSNINNAVSSNAH
jgi:hypothetical protein